MTIHAVHYYLHFKINSTHPTTLHSITEIQIHGGKKKKKQLWEELAIADCDSFTFWQAGVDPSSQKDDFSLKTVHKCAYVCV